MCLEGYEMRWKWQKRKTEKKDRKKDRKERKKLVQSRLETEGVAEKQCRKIRAEDHPFHRFKFWFIITLRCFGWKKGSIYGTKWERPPQSHSFRAWRPACCDRMERPLLQRAPINETWRIPQALKKSDLLSRDACCHSKAVRFREKVPRREISVC